MKSVIPSSEKPSPLVIIHQSELDYISRCILSSPRIETGGQLFGLWTDNGIPVVMYVLGPGPGANHQIAFFNQDATWLQSAGQKVIDRYGIQHIGEWHSHHELGLSQPSGHDVRSILVGMDSDKLNRFVLGIGVCRNGVSSINAFTFHKDYRQRCEEALWEVKPGESPIRTAFDKEFSQLVYQPGVEKANMGGLKLNRPADGEAAQEAAPIFKEEYWIRKKENTAQLKQIMDFLAAKTGVIEVHTQVSENGELNLKVVCAKDFFDVLFPLEFPKAAPLVSFIPVPGAEWKYDGGEIAGAFMEYYDKITQ